MFNEKNKYKDISEELKKQGYSEKVIENWFYPKNFGIIDSQLCDGYSDWNECPFGDSMAICLKIDGERIQEATFLSDICIGSVSAASMLTEKVKNMTIVEAAKISSKEIIDELGSLPEEFVHCADLAKDTLMKAIIHYHETGFREAPWKKMYRRS